MIPRYLFPGLCTLLLLSSCLGEDKPVCTTVITTDKDSYAAGEEITFHLEGHSDQIVFFSGESGHVYDNSSYHYDDNALLVSFVSYQDGATPVHNNCQFLVSYDFDGNYTPEGVAAATWNDCSDAFGFTTTGANTASRELDLKEVLPESKRLENPTYYMAFRYYDMDPEHPVNNRWCIRSIDVKRVLLDGKEEILGAVSTGGWVEVVISGCALWSVGTVQLLALGSTTAIYQTPAKDSWVITRGFAPNKMDPDSGEVIKSLHVDPGTFSYTYSEPGTYEAVFYCSSVRYNGSARKVVRKTITVR